MSPVSQQLIGWRHAERYCFETLAGSGDAPGRVSGAITPLLKFDKFHFAAISTLARRKGTPARTRTIVFFFSLLGPTLPYSDPVLTVPCPEMIIRSPRKRKSVKTYRLDHFICPPSTSFSTSWPESRCTWCRDCALLSFPFQELQDLRRLLFSGIAHSLLLLLHTAAPKEKEKEGGKKNKQLLAHWFEIFHRSLLWPRSWGSASSFYPICRSLDSTFPDHNDDHACFDCGVQPSTEYGTRLRPPFIHLRTAT